MILFGEKLEIPMRDVISPNAHVVLFINIVHIILIIAPIKLINLMVRALPFRRTRLEVQIVYITLLNNGD